MLKRRQAAYDEWFQKHQEECVINHSGSAGLKEVNAAKVMWQRRLLQASAQQLRKKIMTTLHHASSTDESPQHDGCPAGKASWCFYKRALAHNQPPPSHKGRPMVADPELPDIDIARPRAHCSSSSPNTDTPFVPDAAPQADTLINLLVPSVSCDAAPQGDTSINLLAHTVSSDAASPKMFASPEIFLGYPKAAPRKENQQREKTWKMYDRNIITNDGGNKIKAVH
nr:hypothetical protein BgiMline_019786 [Biomphalaria glabrata]